MTYYVIDTNFVHLDFFLKGTNITTLTQTAELLNHKVCMPMVVFDEMVKQYKELADEAICTCDKLKKDFYRLGERDVTMPIEEIKKGVEQYSNLLMKICEDLGILLLQYPTIAHQDVVKRNLNRRKPFREFEHGMTGYRDTLIWESVLELCGHLNHYNKVVLLTSNSQDFGSKQKGLLSKDLIEDLVQCGWDKDRVRLVSSFHTFINDEIIPASQKIETIILKTWKAGEIDIMDVVGEHVNGKELTCLLAGDEYNGIGGFTPPFYETTEVMCINHSCNYSMYDIRKLPKGDVMVSVEVDINVTIDCFIYKADLPLIDQEELPYIFDRDWNEHYVAASDEADLTVRYMLLLDPNMKTVTNIDQLLIHAKYETGFEYKAE